jgi:hypothetical protein
VCISSCFSGSSLLLLDEERPFPRTLTNSRFCQVRLSLSSSFFRFFPCFSLLFSFPPFVL